MEPLSAIASVIALAQGVSSTLTQVSKFYGARTDISSLMNEVSDLRLILQELDYVMQDRGQNTKFSNGRVLAIMTVLRRAEGEFTVLNEAIKQLYRTATGDGQDKASRTAWMRRKSSIVRLQSQLRDTRLTLSTLCSNLTMQDLSRLQIQVDGLSLLHDDYHDKLLQQNQFLELLLKQEDGKAGDSVDNNSDGTTSTSEETTANGEVDVPDPNSAQNRPYSPTSTIRVGATRYGVSCHDWCGCDCHRPSVLWTPRAARDLLGFLFIGYSGVPLLRRPCNERSCKKQTGPALRISYYFPTWFLRRMVQFVVTNHLARGPEVSLRMPRVIPDISEVFLYACQGNLPKLRSLFARKVASPYDVGSMTGRTPLHYAVNYRHPEVARFLIESGADPEEVDMEQTTPTALAWRCILGALSSPSNIDAFRLLFQDEEFLDSRAFQPLHKIVLGLSGASLRERLELSTGDIDEVDADGRTALSWAATRDDVEAVKTLLEFGANPNLASIWGQLPLHCATHNKKESPIEIIEELIAHGTNVNAVDYWKRTALCYASGNYRGLETLQLLVSAGTLVDLRDIRLRTPLGYTARLGHLEHAQYLLKCGADPNIPDEYNVTPIYDAVRNNFHDVLRLLIPISTPISIRPFGSSLLHWIAFNADETTLSIVSEFNLTTLFVRSDLSTTNDSGLTPTQLFYDRPSVIENEKRGFLCLLDQIAALEETIDQQAENVDYHEQTQILGVDQVRFDGEEVKLDLAGGIEADSDETSKAEEYFDALQTQ